MAPNPSTLGPLYTALVQEDHYLALATDSIGASLAGGHLTQAEADGMLNSATDTWLRNRRLLRDLFSGDQP